MRPWNVAVLHRVVVNLRSGTAITGVLIRQRGPLLVIADAQVHAVGEEPVHVDGEVIVERAHVDFVQALADRG